jgi:hypothetical protein
MAITAFRIPAPHAGPHQLGNPPDMTAAAGFVATRIDEHR